MTLSDSTKTTSWEQTLDDEGSTDVESSFNSEEAAQLTGRCRSLTQERDILREKLRQKALREAQHAELIQGLQNRLAKLSVLSHERQNRYEELLQAYQQLKELAAMELASDE